MSPMGMVVLSLLTLVQTPTRTVYAPHLAKHEAGAEARAEQIGEWIDAAADAAHVQRHVLAGLLYHESSYLTTARSRVGAYGMGQLYNPRYVRSWKADCKLAPSYCERSQVDHAAWALRESPRACGNYTAAVGHYRSGRCLVRGHERATMRLSWAIAHRLKHPSTKRLVAPRMR